MANKIFIENLVTFHEGKPEKELPAHGAIRFENENAKYTVSWDNATNKLSIYKVTKRLSDDTVKIYPASCNKIIIE